MSKIITLDGLRDYLTNLKRLFVTKTDAESTYETKADAATHLSKSDAAGTYLSKTDAASAYVQTGAVDQTVAGTKTFSNGVLLTDANALMAQNGEYTLVLRNDSRDTYLLMSDKGGVPGTWSDARPLTISNSTGVCSINGNASTATKATQDSDGNQINTTYSKNGHTHDDRYYTENEVNNLLNGKANTSGTYSNLTVGNAGSATNATYTNWLRTSSHSDHLFHTEWDGAYFWTYVTTGNGDYRAVRVARSDSSGNADTAASATNATNSNAANQLQAFVNDDFTDGNHYVKAIRSSQGWSTHLWMCYNNGAKMADEVSVNYANSAGNAATATKATQDSDGNQINTTYSKNGHTHDDRYYTEAEVNNLLAGKADSSHTHPYIPTSASCNKNWHWSGQPGQPSWLWGGEDGTNMYVYSPANFRVNYANSAYSAIVADNGVYSQGENWIRFRNGIQICWDQVLCESSEASTWTYGASFSSTPVVTVCDNGGNNNEVYLTRAGNIGTTSCLIVMVHENNGSHENGLAQCIAIGKWK